MPITTFQPGTILYAANLNTAFANSVNIAGDTMTGPLVVPTIILGGSNVILQIASTNANVNTNQIITQAAFNRANQVYTLNQTIQTANGLTVNNGTSLSVSNIAFYTISANVASPTVLGVTKLNDTTSSNFANTAATANAVNTVYAIATAAYNRANSASGSTGQQTFLTRNGLTANGNTSLTVFGNNTVQLSANLASTLNIGVVQLVDSVTSVSSSTAATPNSVNAVYNVVQSAYNVANVSGSHTSTYIGLNGISVNSGSFLTVSGNSTVVLTANLASNSGPGMVQLDDQAQSLSVTKAATANIVTSVAITAAAAFNRANMLSGLSNGQILIATQTVSTGLGLTVNNGTSITLSGNSSYILTANQTSISAPGIVQLVDTTANTSILVAPTAAALNLTFEYAKAAYTRANSSVQQQIMTYNAGNGLTVNGVMSVTTVNDSAVTYLANNATQSNPGIVQLYDGYDLADSTKAATANTVYNLYNYANAAYSRANSAAPTENIFVQTFNGISINGGSQDTITGNGTMNLVMINATINNSGVIQLSNNALDQRDTSVPTSNVLSIVYNTAKAAFDAANGFSGGVTMTYLTANGITVNNGTSLVTTGSATIALDIISGSPTQRGTILLSDAYTSNSIFTSPTSNALNSVAVLAQSAFNAANNITTTALQSGGGTINGTLNVTSDLYVTGGNTSLANNIFSSNGTIILGTKATSRGGLSKIVYAPAFASANTGEFQVSDNILYKRTSNTDIVTLTADGMSVKSNTSTDYGIINVIQLPNNSVYAFEGYVIGRDLVTNVVKIWQVRGGVKRGANAASTQFVTGAPVIDTMFDDDPVTSLFTISIDVSTTSGSILFHVGGSTNPTDWGAKIETLELA